MVSKESNQNVEMQNLKEIRAITKRNIQQDLYFVLVKIFNEKVPGLGILQNLRKELAKIASQQSLENSKFFKLSIPDLYIRRNF
ncbi:CLUMA_CG013609, isoform A [Clunio marinus]|uniref:CLUMA_CG013609, isoform A n=1 Tax=Clunio marinus TaxID=568069 RepID=A0A1J1IJG1_9DIPT|nr:CLUMA_CG013609, isoform A [Clunio marinus]